MHNKWLWVLILIAIVVGIMFWSVGGSRIEDEAPYYLKKIINETGIVEINDQVFEVEIARTAKARAKGLAGRDYLATGKGMLFVFPEPGIYPFTLEQTNISLDIVWILDDEVVKIANKVEPGHASIDPGVKANYVLEVRANSIKAGLGDKVMISFDK